MKKNTTLELIEQSSKVSLYSISFEMDHTTEFERFMCKFESESTLNKDYQKINLCVAVDIGKRSTGEIFPPGRDTG